MILNKEELYSIETVNMEIEKNILKSCFQDMALCLLENKKMLGESQANETGKGIKFCIKEVERTATLLKYGVNFIDEKYNRNNIQYGEFNGTYVRRNIKGKKVLAISTFSSPYSSFVHKMMGVLLADGTMFFKPSTKVYNCSTILYKLLEKIMMKYDLYNIHLIVGIYDYQMQDILQKLSFEVILFTGKCETAEKIKKIIPNIPGIYETGSLALAYVSNDYDYRKLKTKLCEASFAQSGMRCIALKNLFVHRNNYDNVKKILIEDIHRLHMGEANNPNTDIGPIRDSDTLAEIHNYIKYLENKGYNILTGGEREKDFLIPTLLEDVNNKELSIREMYGPVMILHCVDNFKKIPLNYYKRSSLQSAIYSNDYEEIIEFVKWNQYCGNICINYGPALRIDSLSFGGFFDENEGRESLENIINIISSEQLIIKEHSCNS